MEQLTITEGALAGQRMRLMPWQRRFIRGFLRPDVRTSALSCGRGNAKSTTCAAIAVAALIGPLAQRRGLCVIAAPSVQVGQIIGDHVLHFVRELCGPELPTRTWSVQSSHRAQRGMTHKPTGATVKVIGSTPRYAYGLAPSLILCDEPAAWTPSTADEMLTVLTTSAGKRECRIIALGTRPADDSHWFAKWLAGDADYAQVHAARMDAPRGHKRTWQMANPSLMHLPDLEPAIRREWRLAKAGDDNAMQSFRALRLNQGVNVTADAVLIEADRWERSEALYEDSDGPLGMPIFGFDGGGAAAMSACAAFWPKSGVLDAVGSFPRQPSLAERARRDNVGPLYRTMAKEGDLIQVGDESSDWSELLVEAVKRFGRPSVIVHDRWRKAELADAATRAGLAGVPRVARGTGWLDGNEDVDGFRRGVFENEVKVRPSTLIRSSVGAARVQMDAAGNVKLCKQAENGRRLRDRDDVAAACILAVAHGRRRRAASTGPSLRFSDPVYG